MPRLAQPEPPDKRAAHDDGQKVVQQGKERCSSMTDKEDGLGSIDVRVTEPAGEGTPREVMMRAPDPADLQALQFPRDWILSATETQYKKQRIRKGGNGDNPPKGRQRNGFAEHAAKERTLNPAAPADPQQSAERRESQIVTIRDRGSQATHMSSRLENATCHRTRSFAMTQRTEGSPGGLGKSLGRAFRSC
jgi:hypothetical protein